MVRLGQLLLLVSLTQVVFADYEMLMTISQQHGQQIRCCPPGSRVLLNCYEEQYELVGDRLFCGVKITPVEPLVTTDDYKAFIDTVKMETRFDVYAVHPVNSPRSTDKYYHFSLDIESYEDVGAVQQAIEPITKSAVVEADSRSRNSFVITVKEMPILDKAEWNRVLRTLVSWTGFLGSLLCYGVEIPPNTEIEGYFIWSEAPSMREARMEGAMAAKVHEFCCLQDEFVRTCEVVDYETTFKGAVLACRVTIEWYNTLPVQSLGSLWHNKPHYVYSVITPAHATKIEGRKFEFDVQLQQSTKPVKPDISFVYFDEFSWKNEIDKKLEISMNNLPDRNLILNARWFQSLLILARIEQHSEVLIYVVSKFNYPPAMLSNQVMQTRREVLVLVHDVSRTGRNPCETFTTPIGSAVTFSPDDCRKIGGVSTHQNLDTISLVHMNVWLTPGALEHWTINRNLQSDQCTTTVINTLSSSCYGTYRLTKDAPMDIAGAAAAPDMYFQIIVTTSLSDAERFLSGTDCGAIVAKLAGICDQCSSVRPYIGYIEFTLTCQVARYREVTPRTMYINEKLNEGASYCAFNVRYTHEYKKQEDVEAAYIQGYQGDCFNNKILKDF